MRDDRPLRGREEWVIYLLAGITYIIAGLLWKGLLNWIVGPLWIITWVWFVPPLWDRVRGRGPRQGRDRAEVGR